jgi:hypothetical protein
VEVKVPGPMVAVTAGTQAGLVPFLEVDSA